MSAKALPGLLFGVDVPGVSQTALQRLRSTAAQAFINPKWLFAAPELILRVEADLKADPEYAMYVRACTVFRDLKDRRSGFEDVFESTLRGCITTHGSGFVLLGLMDR